MEGANLKGAHLKDAYLMQANLAGADLSGTSLEGADLRWVHLNDDARFEGARYDDNTCFEFDWYELCETQREAAVTLHRHCERSTAIKFYRDAGLLRRFVPRNDN